MNGVYADDTKMVLCNSVISLEVINDFEIYINYLI